MENVFKLDCFQFSFQTSSTPLPPPTHTLTLTQNLSFLPNLEEK